MSFGAHMLTEAGGLEPASGNADDGSPTFDPVINDVPMRVERNVEIDMGDDGATSDTVTRVWLDREVGKGDRVHLPDGEEMEVAAVETLPSTDGRINIYKAHG